MRYPVRKYAQALYESAKGLSASETEKVARSFIGLLRYYNDTSLLPRIIEQYEKIRTRAEGIVRVEATTAKKLSSKLKSEIEKKFNGKIELVEKVHPEVLGGIKLVVNDEYLIDNTMSGRVERLYEALMAGAAK